MTDTHSPAAPRFVRLAETARPAVAFEADGVGDAVAELKATGAPSTPVDAFSMARFRPATRGRVPIHTTTRGFP